MLVVEQSRASEGIVRVGGRAENDDVDFWVAKKSVRGSMVLDAGVVFRRRVSRGRGALDNGVQRQGWGKVDEGDVEDLGREAVNGLNVSKSVE